MWLGYNYKFAHKLDSSFYFYNDSYKISAKLGDSTKAALRLLDMSTIQRGIGDYVGCKITAIDGLKFVQESEELRTIAGLYHNISVAARELKNHEEALDYNLRAINLGKDSTSIKKIKLSNILIFKNTRANILADIGNYNDAKEVLVELSNDLRVKRIPKEIARVTDNLGYITWLEGKDLAKSKELLLNAYETRKKINDKQGLIASNVHLSKFYGKNQKEESLQHARKALQHSIDRNSKTAILEALSLIFKLGESTNEEAILYDSISQELSTLKQKNQRIYAVTKYDNDELIKENYAKQTENAKKDRQIIAITSALAFSTLFIIFIVYYKNQQNKKARFVEAYKTETRLSKKVHDELANDVYNLMTQLENKEIDGEVIDQAEDIYHRTRDISKENSSIETGEGYTQDLTSMVSSYAPLKTKVIVRGLQDIVWNRISKEKKIVLYRTLQELMTNMRKHSEASLVAITASMPAKTLEVTYSDNGKGVDSKELRYGNGLRNAENRISSINGSFTFDTEKGKGFRSKIQIPS